LARDVTALVGLNAPEVAPPTETGGATGATEAANRMNGPIIDALDNPMRV
jgi:hypothetical protein